MCIHRAKNRPNANHFGLIANDFGKVNNQIANHF